jgi:Flp pilus assembly protein TadB
MSDLDDFHATVRAITARHVKRMHRARRIQVLCLVVDSGVFAFEVTAGVGDALMAAALAVVIMFGLIFIVRQTRAINRTKRPDYFYIDQMDMEIYGRTFDHGR